MRSVKAGALYFAVVFAAGFVLGPIRLFLVVPRVGVRTAELMESPIMLLVAILAARWIVRQYGLSSSGERLAAGCLALVLTLAAEFGLVLRLRGLSIREYLATRDPVSGAVYCGLLVVLALLPLVVRREQDFRG